MPVPEINTVCFVGAGTMGCYNSLVAAVSGYQVVLYDRSEDMLQQVLDRHAEWAPMLVAGGYCSDDDVKQAAHRVVIEDDLAKAVASADLVSESISEQLDAKRELFALLDAVCPAETVITSNTSSILVSEMEDVVERGDKFAALHSHIGSPLFDIVVGPRTSLVVVDLLTRYVESLDCMPLVQHKEHPGYVLNAMIGPVLAAALSLVIEDEMQFEQVDRAWMELMSAPMGPFGMMDLFGLNVIKDSWSTPKRDDYRGRLQPGVLALLEPMIASGKLGMKTGEGFYAYPEPSYQATDFIGAQEVEQLARDTLLVTLIGSAVLIASKGVAEPHNIDMAWTVGTHLPVGPFALLANYGEAAIESLLADHESAGRISTKDTNSVREYLQSYSSTN